MSSTTQGRTVSHTTITKWLIVVLLSVIATCLVLQAGVGTSSAVAQTESGEKSGIFAVSAQLSSNLYGLYLVDTESARMAVYEYVPDKGSGHKLRFKAARNYKYDLMLDEYNTEPMPREIKGIVEHNQPLDGAASQPSGE